MWTRVDAKKKRLLVALAILLVVGMSIALFAWYHFFRDVPQPDWITSDDRMNFLYGSIGSESQAGIPYWIIVVLPRIFGEYLPGPGGYASLGLPWEESQELPAGFSKKTIGFERVGFNCALCHATQYRTHPDLTPTIVAAGARASAALGMRNRIPWRSLSNASRIASARYSPGTKSGW